MLAGLLVAGCAGGHNPGAKPAGGPKVIVTPETGVTGKVKKVNEAARFVILSFPAGKLPPNGTTLRVYHGGVRTGDVRIVGPQQDQNTVADLITGQAQEGDDARGN